MSEIEIGGMRLVPIGGEPSALSAPPDVVMQRARAAVGAAEPEELTVGGMRLVPIGGEPATSGLTVVPKGGVPRMGTPAQRAALELAAPFMEPKPIPRETGPGEAAQHALENQGIRWLTNIPNVPGRLTNAAIGVPGVVPDVVNAEPEEIRAAFAPGDAEHQFKKSAQYAQEHPYWTAGAEVGADVLGVSVLRQPLSTAMRRSEQGLMHQIDNATGRRAMDPNLSRWERTKKAYEQKTSSTAFLTGLKGGGRAAEAVAEGLVIGAVNDRDPMTTGAMAGAGQLASSVVLQGAMAKVTGKPLVDIGIKALAAGVGIHLLTDGAVLPDIETGFDKVKIGVAAALVAAAGGGGRLGTKGFASALPEIADGVGSVSRLTTTALLNKYVVSDESTQAKIKTALHGMMTGQGMTVETREALSRAMDRGPDAFLRTIDQVMKK